MTFFDEWIFTFMVFKQLSTSIIVKEELLPALYISLREKCYHMSPLTHLDFRSEVILTLVTVVDEAGLVTDEARVDSATVVAEVVEVIGLPQSLSDAF